MQGKSKGRLIALVFFMAWVAVIVASSYRLLDAGTSILTIPVMGFVSFVIMIIGVIMFMSSFQNINAAMVREFHEVEIPSLSRFMGTVIWVASIAFYCVFAIVAPISGTTIGAILSVIILVAIVLGVTVYSSRSEKFQKS